MGSTPFDSPEMPSAVSEPPIPDSMQMPPAIPVPVPKVEPVTRYVILFVLTLLTTTFAGQLHYASFVLGFSSNSLNMTWWNLLLHGLWYSLPILGILGAHEFGHYFACRHYRVDASRPYFLPMPILLTGTLG